MDGCYRQWIDEIMVLEACEKEEANFGSHKRTAASPLRTSCHTRMLTLSQAQPELSRIATCRLVLFDFSDPVPMTSMLERNNAPRPPSHYMYACGSY